VLAEALIVAAAAAPLPAVEVSVDRRIGRRRLDAQMRAPGFEGDVAIATRGRWSRHFPKKSYAFEVREEDGSNRNVALLGMPADDDWILYASWNDRTLMRNVLAYDTARRMGRYAARTRYVDLRVNGRYRGVYVLMEKPKLHRARVRGDFLLEGTSPRQARRKDPSFRTPIIRRPIVWEDPERGDLGRRAAARIRDRVVRAERALYLGPPGAWRRHIHAPAAVDYMLIQELFKNQDAMEVSTFMSARRGRLELGPVWDFDMSMGATKRSPGRFLEGWMASGRPWASRLYADRAFARAMARRWAALRRAGLRGWLLRTVRAYDVGLRQAARGDSRRWPAGGERPRGTRQAHVRELRRWLVRRIAWLDRSLPGLGR
jgi:CotH kinase protein